MLKRIKIILLAFTTLFCLGCEGLIVEESIGCLSGIFPSTNNRVYIFCITRSEYANLGGNSFNGVTYDNILWTEVEDCDECLTLDYSQL